MEIINNQLVDGATVISDLPKLSKDATVNVWVVPTEYQANGYFVSTDNSIPACDHDEPVFAGTLPADEDTKKEFEFNLTQTYLTSVVQDFLDKTAQSKGYDSMISATSYVNSTNPTFKSEAIAAVAWRDSVWTFCYDLLTKIKSGTVEIPSESDLIGMLPVITW